MGFQRLARDRRFVSDDVNVEEQRPGRNAFAGLDFQT
jgi:hypothetical protein